MNTIQFRNIPVAVPSENFSNEQHVDRNSDIIDTQASSKTDSAELKNSEAFNNKVDTATADDYKNLLRNAKLDINDENVAYARFLRQNNIEVKSQTVKELKSIKENIDYIADNCDAVTLDKLMENGLTLDKLTPEAAANFISDYSSYKNIGTEAVSDEEIKKTAEKYGEDATIAEALIKSGCAVTDKNIAEIKKAVEKLETTGKLDKDTIVSIIKENKQLTVNNLYVAKFTSNKVPEKKLTDNEWNQLKSDVEKIFKSENIDLSKKNIENAKILIENDIPVTKENLAKFELLEDTEKNIDTNEVIENAAQKIAANQPASSADVADFSDSKSESENKTQIFENYIDIIHKLNNITDTDIKNVVESGKDVTIENLNNSVISDSKVTESDSVENNHSEDIKGTEVIKPENTVPKKEEIKENEVHNKETEVIKPENTVPKREEIKENEVHNKETEIKKPEYTVPKNEEIEENEIHNKETEIKKPENTTQKTDNVKNDKLHNNETELKKPVNTEENNTEKQTNESKYNNSEITDKNNDNAGKNIEINVSVIPPVKNNEVDDNDKKADTEENIEIEFPKENITAPVTNAESQFSESNSDADNYKQQEIITAKRQLAEIQLKLTTEAAVRLAGKGIEIDTMPLKEALEELKTVEREIYQSSLKTMGVEPSQENTRKMEEVFTKLESLAPTMPFNVFDKIINKEIDFTIDGINEAVVSNKVFDTLDTFATAPSTKFGDTFSSVSSQFENLLSDLNIEPTETNIKAAKILSRNEMDVSEENIIQIKNIDLKVTEVHDNLKPLAAARMIKDGLNPVDMNIDDVLNYIDDYNSKFALTPKERIAEGIIDLKNNENISKEERDAVVAVYRMINTIEKYGSASIGTAVKNDTPLTLGNLMEASKVFEKTKRKDDFNVSVDDSFGMTDEIIVPEKNIRGTIEKALKQNEKYQNNENNNLKSNTVNNEMAVDLQAESNISESNIQKQYEAVKTQNDYIDAVIKSIGDTVSNEGIIKVIKENPKVFEQSIETFASKLKQQSQIKDTQKFNDTVVKEYAQQVKNIKDLGSDVINWMNKNNIPVTVANLQVVSGMVKNPFSNDKELNKFKKNAEDNKIAFGKSIPDLSLSQLIEGKTPEEIVNDISEEIENAENEFIENADAQNIDIALEQAKSIKRAAGVQKSINSAETGQFQIPVEMSNGDVTTLNMYILNSDNINSEGVADGFKSFMAFETSRLGVVQIGMAIDNGEISLKFGSTNKNALSELEGFKNKLSEYVENAGFKLKNADFDTGEKFFKENLNENVKIFNNQYEILI